MEKEGRIGKLHEAFYSTTGVGTTLEYSAKMEKRIAEHLEKEGVDAVILTST